MSNPEAKTQMLIRRPVEAVCAAFIQPEITTQFWFSHASGPLVAGATIRWEWRMFGQSADVLVKELVPDRRIVIAWPGQGTTNTVAWDFTAKEGGHTLVAIRESGFDPAAATLTEQVADSTGGFNLVLAGAKAWLEHGIELNLVRDRFPDGPPCAQ